MCELISRQVAINKINERQRKLIYCFGFENDVVKIMDIAKSIIIAIPSAQPERKTGRWIYHADDLFPAESKQECSCCHESEYMATINNDNFCPNCGAKME